MTSDRAGRTLVVLSGGLDSAVAAYTLRDAGHKLGLISFDYGQRHKRELACASLIAERLKTPHIVFPVLIPKRKTALGADVPVPHGHYAHESMKVTVVPNRNLFFATIAHSVAVEEDYDSIALGVHRGDHYIYPDCRPEFYRSLEETLKLSAGEIHKCPRVLTPLIHLDKAGVVTRGAMFSVPFKLTWSCYEGGEVHCGKCGTCVERRLAFEEAGVTDPTEYADV